VSERSLEEIAQKIFGSEQSQGYHRWIEYWSRTRSRNRELLERLKQVVLIDFARKRVLDVGCGTGGLGEIVGASGADYVGIDLHRHVLQFARPSRECSFAQCNAVQLPFADQSFDFVFAFDVIEHLTGGSPWQIRFLQELRRLLLPTGMIFLTTPNFWYPYDAHSQLCFPHYLPGFLQNHYLHWRSPEFLKEHGSFRNIRLLTPHKLRSLLEKQGLIPLHELPCCLDRDEYLRLNPFRGLLSHLGLGWYFHAEFWLVLVHSSSRSRLRKKLQKTWFYEINQPSGRHLADFGPLIDFDTGPYSHQLASGWHWHEKDKRGFRWTSRRAICYLQTREGVRYLYLKGYSPIANHFRVQVDDCLVGEHHVAEPDGFELKYLLPFPETENRIFEVVIESVRCHTPHTGDDERELGLMVFSVELS
jgi:2-polyprenyl-3-methyl-5-hydroxy-6-metoxy-1,4-benzoquinol methylase